MKKVSLSGGPPVTLADAAWPAIAGASWNNQGTIAFRAAERGPILQASDSGCCVQPPTRLAKGEGTHRYPEFLPGGTALLFTVVNFQVGLNFQGSIAVQSPKTSQHRELIRAGIQPRVAPSGHIVYSQGATLMAAPFDPRRLAITGAAVSVIENVLPLQYSFSSNGTLVYVPGSVQAVQARLVWVDRKGVEQPIAAPVRGYVFPRLSPEGQRVAVNIEEGDGQIWLYDLARDTPTRLTFEGANNIDPVWTPDGKRIAFKGAANRLFWQPADGGGAAEALTNEPLSSNNFPSSWSPNGQALAFVQQQQVGFQSLWILPLNDRKPQLFERSQSANETTPDGLWIAYISNESGQDEIFVRPYPGPGGKHQISTEGGREPVWNPNGRELFYRVNNKMMAVEVPTQPAFLAGKPRVLFEGAYLPSPRSLPNYDLSPDGQRFLMLKATDQAPPPTQINVVLNWFEELKRRVPSGKK